MLKSLSMKMQRFSKGWLAAVSLMIFFVFTSRVLPAQTIQAEKYSGEIGSPDTTFFYSTQDLYRFAEAYGEEGRAAYVRVRATFDVAWPLVYTFFMVTTISWLSAWAFASDSIIHLFNLVPLLAMLFDFLENGTASLVMLRYPQLSPLAAGLAPVVSVIKWALVMGSFGLLVFCLGAALFKRLFRSD
jgi:hypothetical protein